MNKQQLAAKIWESANQMRSKIEANEYKDYILGFIFYKYLSDKLVREAKKDDFTDDDIKNLNESDQEIVNHFKNNIGYFISYENLFSTWLKMGNDFNVSNVRDALSAFNRLISPVHKKVFEGIFKTLETGLSKLGENASKQTKAISELIYLIKDIPMDGKQDYDVLGFIYEYLISMFAANAGKKAGEFYTPHEVSLLMSEIVADHLKDKKSIEIYDPTSGSGSLLINIGHSISKHMDNKHNIKYYAQELKENTYNLTRMNLVMRDIKPSNIITRNGNTLEEDWPYFDESDPIGSYNALYVDAVVSNPPYSQHWNPTNQEVDPRYARFGLAPKSKADYAFLLHDLYHLKPDGIMTIVLPHGVLFRGGEEGEIRKNLIEGNHIDTIIGLPANIFFGTGIPTVILVLKQKRGNTDIQIIDASKGFVKVGKNNLLRSSDIKRITDTVVNRIDVSKYSRVVTREEVRENDYNLNIPRYVDSSEPNESWDIYASMFGGIPNSELETLDKYWIVFPGLKESIFRSTSDSYVELVVDDVKKSILDHKSIKDYFDSFSRSFSDIGEYLKNQLVSDMSSIKLSQKKNDLAIDIFKRLEMVELIDKYVAFQLLDDQWLKISGDIEIIQSEGFNSIKQVNPNIVIKKKKGKDVEVQEGWIGHILPFELVQRNLLKTESEFLNTLVNRSLEITSELEEILDSMTEEDKEAETINDNGDGFVKAQITKEAKRLIKEANVNGSFSEESYEYKIIKIDELFTEEKNLKKRIKIEGDKLHMKTKDTIESLSNDEALRLIDLKWNKPLIEAFHQLPYSIIDDLVSKVIFLSEKYKITFDDVEKNIKETEKSLSSLIDNLVGNEYDMKGLSELKSLLKGE